MSDATDQIDAIMEQASEALARMHYIRCERLCLEALQLARQGGDFDLYARILLPLQEARRQRRQTALDAGVVVLTRKQEPLDRVLDDHRAGCLLLVGPPFDEADEQALRQTALDRELLVEVLRLDQARLQSTFEHEMEVLGDAELAKVSSKQPLLDQLDALADVLHRVGDHEIAHQRLAEVARQLSHEQAAR